MPTALGTVTAAEGNVRASGVSLELDGRESNPILEGDISRMSSGDPAPPTKRQGKQPGLKYNGGACASDEGVALEQSRL